MQTMTFQGHVPAAFEAIHVTRHSSDTAGGEYVNCIATAASCFKGALVDDWAWVVGGLAWKGTTNGGRARFLGPEYSSITIV